MRRLLFLDTLRGWFIFLVLFIHCVINVIFKTNTGAVNDINPVIVLLLTPIILIATWAPVFAFISGTANVYVAYGLMKRNPCHETLMEIVKGLLINSSFVIGLSYMNMSLFHHSYYFNNELQNTLLSGLVESGKIVFYPQILFYTDALHIIGLSGMVLAFLMFILWRKDGFQKQERNVNILISIGIFILLVSPLLNQLLIGPYYDSLNNKEYWITLLIKIVIGPRQSLFPNGANAIFGAVFGIMLAQERPYEQIKEFGYRCGWLFIAADVFLIIPMKGISINDFFVHDLPITIYLLNLGLQMLLFTYLIGKMEYRTPEDRLKVAKKSVFFRRFGLLALTIYILEGMLSELVGYLFQAIFGPNLNFPQNLPVSILFVVFTLVLWHIILKIWEKGDFKYSFEWYIVNIVGRLRGRLSTRLKVAEVLYNPINIKEEELALTADWNFPIEALDRTELQRLRDKLTRMKSALLDTVKIIKKLPKKERKNVIKIFNENLKQSEDDDEEESSVP